MLRQQLELGAKPVFAATDDSVTQSILLGVDLHSEGLCEVKLNSYLRSEPLSQYDDRMHIDQSILDNCAPTVLARYQRQENRISQKLDDNPAGLYEVLEELHAA
jgi:hypothetical protein